MSVIRRRDQRPQSTPLSGECKPDGWSLRYPGLWEMLAVSQAPDGATRRLSTLLLFYDDGQVKACLNDRDQGLTAWASADGVEAVLEALERGLQADTLDWRRPAGPSKRKK